MLRLELLARSLGGPGVGIGPAAHAIEAARAAQLLLHAHEREPELREVLDFIGSGFFSPEQRNLFQPILHSLLRGGDPFFVLADFAAYVQCQERVSQLYLDPEQWSRVAILNVAAMGKFSSDRTIAEYAADIWQVKPVPVSL